jgi:cytochrome b subunit of formate dehydrogenase
MMEPVHKWNARAFVSITIFLLFVLLLATGICIQVIEAVADEETAMATSLPAVLHFVTAVHVAAGFCFSGTAVFHALKNERVLKNYFRGPSARCSREARLALSALTIFIILIGALSRVIE